MLLSRRDAHQIIRDLRQQNLKDENFLAAALKERRLRIQEGNADRVRDYEEAIAHRLRIMDKIERHYPIT